MNASEVITIGCRLCRPSSNAEKEPLSLVVGYMPAPLFDSLSRNRGLTLHDGRSLDVAIHLANEREGENDPDGDSEDDRGGASDLSEIRHG